MKSALAALLIALASLFAPGTSRASGCSTIEVWTKVGCPHCGAAKLYLKDLAERRPDLDIEIYPVEASRENLEKLITIYKERGITAGGVPTFFVCGEVIVGFDAPETTGSEIEALLSSGKAATPTIDAPLIGEVGVEQLGLPLFTIVIGLIDGFNPCAMWVLLFLLSLLVNLKDRRRILLIAGTFVLVSGAAYFAFMAAWLNVFLLVGFSRGVQVALGLLALFMGAVHIKDYFALHKGLSLSIPESVKPGLYARTRAIIQAENLPAALAGAVVLAVMVNVVELLCTAGLPALYTQILTQRALGAAGYYGYLLLYNLAYIADDSLMVGLVVITMSRRKLQEEEGRWLKLLSGAVIFVLGLLLLLRPNWLNF
ncbi:MAG: NrdH-redoxin [Chrysiogenetes bacterium]|nr:NrdH-redoxin [Chrysiogenetes bacterium]